MQPHEFYRTRYTSPGNFIVVDELGGETWYIDCDDVSEEDGRTIGLWIDPADNDDGLPIPNAQTVADVVRKYVPNSPIAVETVSIRCGYGWRLAPDAPWEVEETAEAALAAIAKHVDLDEEPPVVKRPESPAGRMALAKDVFDAFVREFESFRKNDIGANLAYLLGAILHDPYQDGFIQLFPESGNGDRQFLTAMKRIFPKGHVVWLYIEIDTDEE